MDRKKRRAKGTHRLSKTKANLIKERGKYHDGGGLTFNVRQSGSRNWTFRYNYNKRRREMNLDSISTTGIDTALARAKRMRDMLVEGKDPIDEMKQSRYQETQRILARMNQKTFKDACGNAINSKIPTWKNPTKQVARWRKSLFDKCDFLLDRPVGTISTNDIVKTLQPIWVSQNNTADIGL